MQAVTAATSTKKALDVSSVRMTMNVLIGQGSIAITANVPNALIIANALIVRVLIPVRKMANVHSARMANVLTVRALILIRKMENKDSNVLTARVSIPTRMAAGNVLTVRASVTTRRGENRDNVLTVLVLIPIRKERKDSNVSIVPVLIPIRRVNRGNSVRIVRVSTPMAAPKAIMRVAATTTGNVLSVRVPPIIIRMPSIARKNR